MTRMFAKSYHDNIPHAHSDRLSAQAQRILVRNEVADRLAPLVDELAKKHGLAPRTITRVALQVLGVMGN